MPIDSPPDSNPVIERAPRPRRRRGRWLAGAVVLAAVGGAVWIERLPLATRAIDRTLAMLDLVARYRVTEVGPTHVVLSDVVVGDPARPDLTAARVEIGAGFNSEGIGLNRVIARGVRLTGAWRDGALHFGALDPLINAPTGRPARLPAVELTLRDAVVRLSAPWGAAVVRAEGAGPLRDGFVGRVRIAAAPVVHGCRGGAVQSALALRIDSEVPRLTGPVTIAAVHCGDVAMAAARASLDLRVDRALAGGDADLALHVPGGVSFGGSSAGGARLGAAQAGARMTWRGGRLVGVWHVAGARLAAAAVTARAVGAAGGLRMGETLRVEGHASTEGLALTPAADRQLGQAGSGLAGTPLAPLGAAFVQAARREAHGAQADVAFTLRRGGGHLVLVVPGAAVTGSGGTVLARADRVMIADGALSGHVVTGGPGLPRIAATVARPVGAPATLALSLADYAAGGAHLAIPAFSARQAGGGWQMAGGASASGPVGDGAVSGLALPIAGTWAHGALGLWPRCTPVSVQGLVQGTLRIGPTRTVVCPAGAGSIVTVGSAARVAARVPELTVAGSQSGVPVRLAARDLTLGSAAGGVRFGSGALALSRGGDRLSAAGVSGHLAGGVAGGTVSGGQVHAAVLPFALEGVSGDWRYAGGALDLAAGMTVADGAAPARFAPLRTRDARVHLAGGFATAAATLAEPVTGRTVLTLAVSHDLATARGHADLVVPGLVFDKALQPTALSALALGVVADVKGTVSGAGRIDWVGDSVSSSGSVSTAGLDLAAAFGPVQGLAGTVTFSDLLGLVTPPHQVVTVAAINPGVEVDNGTFAFQLLPGRALAIEGAHWPFLDGELTLLPTRMTFGAAEERRYELVVKGLDAAKFLVHMNVSNLSATGRFDGDLPVVFDRDGNGSIVGGILLSRPPGGTVSYVGELSYRDLTPIANYAFQTLRSLRYARMQVAMDGPIAGEIVTRVGMDGIGQGPTAKRNFITRQIARLPIRFNVNIRAPFYQLLGSFRSFYDPSLVADPRSVGLLDAAGHVIAHPTLPPSSLPKPSGAVQPPLIAPVPQGAP